LRDGRFRYELDNGQAIVVRIGVDQEAGTAVVDFTGTSPQQPNNFNRPRAVTIAAVLYVFRTLIDEPIPLNAGCLRPLRIIVPPVRCSIRFHPRRSSRATSRPRNASSTHCTGRSAAGRIAGHDEQLHVRQRALPVLRDDCRRRRRRARFRRRQRRADAHDEFRGSPIPRSSKAGFRCCCGNFRCARALAAMAGIVAARVSSGASNSGNR
jgi:hypothetical protein